MVSLSFQTRDPGDLGLWTIEGVHFDIGRGGRVIRALRRFSEDASRID